MIVIICLFFFIIIIIIIVLTFIVNAIITCMVLISKKTMPVYNQRQDALPPSVLNSSISTSSSRTHLCHPFQAVSQQAPSNWLKKKRRSKWFVLGIICKKYKIKQIMTSDANGWHQIWKGFAHAIAIPYLSSSGLKSVLSDVSRKMQPERAREMATYKVFSSWCFVLPSKLPEPWTIPW